jgi:Domain of unknown function (DUF4411)
VVYVLDGSSIVSVPILIAEPNETFIELASMLDSGRICFCDEVVSELARTARGEAPYVWARTSAASRRYKGAQYPTIEYVAQEFAQIIDPGVSDTQECAALYVLAQALELARRGLQVTVVTEDRRPKPTRASVAQACEHFTLRCITLLDLLAELDLLPAPHAGGGALEPRWCSVAEQRVGVGRGERV